MKITEGPWKYDSAGMTVMSSDGQMTIADIRGFGYLSARLGTPRAVEIMDANGRAITALPDLLAACEFIKNKWEGGADILDMAEAYGTACEAIKKAMGEE